MALARQHCVNQSYKWYACGENSAARCQHHDTWERGSRDRGGFATILGSLRICLFMLVMLPSVIGFLAGCSKSTRDSTELADRSSQSAMSPASSDAYAGEDSEGRGTRDTPIAEGDLLGSDSVTQSVDESQEAGKPALSDSRRELEIAKAEYARWLQENPEPLFSELGERLFVDAAGTHTIKATVTQINETHVELRKEDGKTVTVRHDQLAALDQEYLDEKFGDYVEGAGPWRAARKPMLAAIEQLQEQVDADDEANAHIDKLYATKRNEDATVLVGTVVRILDGDTIQINDLRSGVSTVRLLGVDAPEKDQRFGPEATHWLERMLHPETEDLIRVEVTEEDRYGRQLGDVYRGEKWINQLLVKAGMAWHYVEYSDSVELQLAQNQARNASRGVWMDAKRVAPWDYRNGVRIESALPKNVPSTRETERVVYVTNSGHKYHRAGCRHLAKSSISIPISRAISAYEPCKVCNP